MTKIFLLNIEKGVSEEECRFYFPQRYEKAGRFRQETDRLRCVAAGVLLHRVLGLQEKDITLGSHGKPFCEKLPMKFNLSHSGKFCVLAVSTDEVGVDIEENDTKHLSVAKAVLQEEELSYMETDPLNRFFALWTMKEAYSKALGDGLTLGFKNINALPLLRGKSVRNQNRDYFGKNLPWEGYSLSICTENALPEPEMITEI